MKNRIQIVYPPLRDPSEIPFLFSSCLETLRASGMNVKVVNANQLFWDDVLDGDQVRERMEFVQNEWEYWETQPSVPPEKQEYVYGLMKARLRRDLIEAKLDQAVQIMKESSSIEEREEARLVLRYTTELFQLPFLPSQLSINDINLLFSTESTVQMEKGAIHPLNFFQQMLSHVAREGIEATNDWMIWVEADQQLLSAFTLTRLILEKDAQAQISWAGQIGRAHV